MATLAVATASPPQKVRTKPVAEFTGDIAGMLELFAVAAGLVLLHRARKEAPAKLLMAAGWLLVVGGIGVGACTTFFWLKYLARGDLDSAHMDRSGMMHGQGHGTTGADMMGPP